MRSGVSIFDDYSTFDFVLQDKFGSNTGNLLFAYSMEKALSTENTEVVSNHYSLNTKDCEKINDEYSAFVIPLANAFRPNNIELERLVSFVEKLKIPCVITGVGCQLPYEPDLSITYPFDDTVKKLCSIVLDKSASIGVRGEITFDYLKKLGFEKHVRIIGCPSAYMNGGKLPVPRTSKYLERNSKVIFNADKNVGKDVWALLNQSFSMFNDYYFVPQGHGDLRLLYSGNVMKEVEIDYPVNNRHLLIKDNRERVFTNVPEWINFYKDVDFVFGTKIHGTIVGILSGAPSYIIVSDSRTRELAEFYNIQHCSVESLNETTSIQSLYNEASFDSVLKDFDKKFDHFIDFLHENDLESCYDNGYDELLDKKVEHKSLPKSVQSIVHCDKEEQIERLDKYSTYINKRISKLQNNKK